MFSADFKVYCTCCDPICYINAQNFTKPVFNWKQSSIPEDSLIKVCLSAEAEEDLGFFKLCLGSNLDFWDEVPATLKLAACSHCQQWGQGSTRRWKNCFPECPKSCVGVRTGITISERQISLCTFLFVASQFSFVTVRVQYSSRDTLLLSPSVNQYRTREDSLWTHPLSLQPSISSTEGQTYISLFSKGQSSLQHRVSGAYEKEPAKAIST